MTRPLHPDGPQASLQPTWVLYTLTVTARDIPESRSLDR